jgi:restriction endonuclease Mrr
MLTVGFVPGSPSEILETLQKVDRKRFEQIVIDLLVTMGYGGSGLMQERLSASQAIKGSTTT